MTNPMVPRYADADRTGAVPLCPEDALPPPTTIRTASGIYFDLARPLPSMVRLSDIADQLAKVNRFTGATQVPYSVAQHCWQVSYILEKDMGAPEAAVFGLMHDAEEAYANDWATPMKRTFQAFGAGDVTERIAHNIRRAVFQRFGLPWPAPSALWAKVKEADRIAFVTERRDLMPPVSDDAHRRWLKDEPAPRRHQIVAWPWDKAAREFMDRARALGLQD